MSSDELKWSVDFGEYTSPPIWLNAHIQDPRVMVGEYTYFDRHITLRVWKPEDRIEIGKFCSLAQDVVIFGGGEHITTRATTFPFKWLSADANPDERYADAATKGVTVIGHDVWIGYRAIVLSGVKIGNGAVIGAGSVVTKDIPDYAIAAGNPARVIRDRFQPETIQRLLKLRWWDWDVSAIFANLDLLYTNPETWAQDLQIKES